MAKKVVGHQVFILPHPRQRHLSRLGWRDAAGTVRHLRQPLPFPYLNHDAARNHAVADGWVVGLRAAWPGRPVPSYLHRARLMWAGGLPRLAALPEIEVSAWQEPHALLVVGNWLYVGGGAVRGYLWPWPDDDEPPATAGPRPVAPEYFVRYDLAAPAPLPEAVPLPVAFGPGKAIDDLLRRGDELLVVDDIVYPKYLFFYHLPPAPALPQWRRTHELPFARVYEHIQGSEWNAGFVALLSSSTGRSGTACYVSVLRRPDLRPVLLLGTYWSKRPMLDGSFQDAGWMLEDVALQDSVLLVACGSRGIARLRLRADVPWPKRRVSTTYFTLSGSPDWVSSAPKRKRETYLREALDLAEAGPADGVAWLPLPAGCHEASKIRFVGPGEALLTGTGPDGRAGAWWLRLEEGGRADE